MASASFGRYNADTLPLVGPGLAPASGRRERRPYLTVTCTATNPRVLRNEMHLHECNCLCASTILLE